MARADWRDSLKRSLPRQTSSGHELVLMPNRLCTCPQIFVKQAYFACRDSTYWVRLVTRCCTSASCPLLIPQNNGPHTGISLDPCAGVDGPPRMVEVTFRAGYLPPLFLLSIVRSAGGVFNALAAGPPPLPSVPWQTAQYDVYISLPDAADVALMVTCWMVVLV